MNFTAAIKEQQERLRLDRIIVGRVIRRLGIQIRNAVRSLAHGYKYPDQVRIQAMRDAVKLIQTLYPPKHKRYYDTWDRWANGNQYGSFNSDDD